MNNIKIIERGFAGHFIAARYCSFHRNTLIELGDKRIVISTVGNYNPPYTYNQHDKDNLTKHEIGVGRFYETMAFWARKEGIYWEADVTKEVYFNSNWAISELETKSDFEADEMHEEVIKEISNKIENLIEPKNEQH